MKSFHYVFQITKSIVFEVSYYRLSNNTEKRFTTSASLFNRPKTDYNQSGQAQESLLPEFTPAFNFYKKFDPLHIKDLTQEQYIEILCEISKLKEKYNFIEKIGIDVKFGFSDIKELAKLPKKSNQNKSVVLKCLAKK